MVYQTGRNIQVVYKDEGATYGVKPGASGASVFRPNTGAINLTKDPIRSNENRADGMTTRGRHGSRNVAGQYSADLSVGSFDKLIEAALRGTFLTALSVTNATSGMSSATLSATGTTITASGGSFVASGLRVGDVVRTTGLGANDDKNIRIVGLTATTITTAEPLTTVAGPVSTWTLARGKKVLQGTTGRSFSFEEQDLDIDGSKVAKGCRVGQFQLSLQPNGMAVITFNLMGQDMEVLEGAGSPYFTAPSTTTSIGLTAVEAKIRLGSGDVIDVSALDLSVNLNGAPFPVVGSNITPDVFLNNAVVEGSVTALKKDMSHLQAFISETEMSLHLLFEEPDQVGAKDYCAFYVGNLTLSGATDSDLGADGPRTVSRPLMIGKDERGGAFDPTMVSFQTSAA